ncbi:MAG: RNA-dependent DNA polymerase, partial [Phototrophicales bacterium]
TYANRVGKGTHKALERCTEFMQKFKYVLPCDVQQFFPAIDHQILKNILSRTIADEAVLRLCGKIIDSGAGVLTEQYVMRYFDGDDLLAVNRPRGLPIGNLTSQFWANVYLNEFDHFVKRQLKCKGYIRYVDDFVLFADDKKQLHDWRDAIIAYLGKLRLTIHENRAQPRPVTQGVTFLGFTIYPTHRRLKRIKGLAYQRRLRAMYKAYLRGEVTAEAGRASVMSWLGHVRHGNTRGLVRKMFAEVKRVTVADIHENRSIDGVVIGTHNEIP